MTVYQAPFGEGLLPQLRYNGRTVEANVWNVRIVLLTCAATRTLRKAFSSRARAALRYR